MKSWTSATSSRMCAYDASHHIATGDRVGLVAGANWQKVYCADCFVKRHNAPPDTGELVETVDEPAFTPLRQLAEQMPDRFDGRMAAAGRDED